MTKQEYIDYWVNTAADDWVTVEGLLDLKRYMHCLFWSHLVLEKLAKAHWVKNHEDNVPPKVHNIVWLLEESGVDLEEETMMFLTKFNRFQLSARYPDYLNKISSTCTELYTVQQLEKIKEVKKCLLEKL
jgi:HEPN domain-containing protein